MAFSVVYSIAKLGHTMFVNKFQETDNIIMSLLCHV